MTKDEALKLALEALEKGLDDCWRETVPLGNQAINAVKEALSSPNGEAHPEQKPFGYTLEETMKCWDLGYAAAVKALEQKRFAQPKEPEQEPVAWPCLIAEADFSENTVILAMQCTDYKVSSGNHWLSNTPPQRTWVELTDDEREELMDTYDVASTDYVHAIEAKLKEKNT